MQVLFDRLEVHRREMQQLLNEAESRDEFEDLLADSRRRMAYDEHHPSESTSAPELPTSTIPVFTDQSFHFGVAVGTPLSVPTGTLAKFTGVAVGLSPAIEIGWNSSHIMTDLSLLWGTLTGSKGDAPHRFLEGDRRTLRLRHGPGADRGAQAVRVRALRAYHPLRPGETHLQGDGEECRGGCRPLRAAPALLGGPSLY